MDIHIGNNCFFCHFEKRLICHRKDGRKHEDILNMKLKQVIKEVKSDQYVRLCFKCHRHVHWCMEQFDMNWTEIERRISKPRTNPFNEHVTN